MIDRLEVAFERARWRYPESHARWIYLTSKDHDQLDDELNALQDYTSAHLSYRDIQIRSGKSRSCLVTNRGCAVIIPKAVSPRVRAAA